MTGEILSRNGIGSNSDDLFTIVMMMGKLKVSATNGGCLEIDE